MWCYNFIIGIYRYIYYSITRVNEIKHKPDLPYRHFFLLISFLNFFMFQIIKCFVDLLPVLGSWPTWEPCCWRPWRWGRRGSTWCSRRSGFYPLPNIPIIHIQYFQKRNIHSKNIIFYEHIKQQSMIKTLKIHKFIIKQKKC